MRCPPIQASVVLRKLAEVCRGFTKGFLWACDNFRWPRSFMGEEWIFLRGWTTVSSSERDPSHGDSVSLIQVLMKKCPYCAEEIQDEAIKCKHCHEFLDETQRPVRYEPPPLPTSRENALPFYLKTSFIVLMFLTLPPVALPLVWLHPKLHWLWKLAITAAVIGFCWTTYIAFKGFIHQFDEATQMLLKGTSL